MGSVSKWIEENFTRNPMLAEVNRFKKKFFSLRGNSTQSVNAGLGLILVFFALFCSVCVIYRGDIPPIPLFFLGLGTQLFLIPIMLHGTIAGERERRSWEMLMVAPITKSQVVCGKFAAAALAFGALTVVFTVPILVTALFYERTHFGRLFLAFLVMLLQGLSLISFTILISARVKRPLMALAVTIGVMMVYYMFMPVVSASFFRSGGIAIMGGLSPFNMLTMLANDNQFSSQMDTFGDPNPYLLFQFVLHFVVAIVAIVGCLTWAAKTLHFADNEVKFISKKNA